MDSISFPAACSIIKRQSGKCDSVIALVDTDIDKKAAFLSAAPAVRMPERKRLFVTKNVLHLFDCLQHFKIRSSHLDIGKHCSPVRLFHRDFENRSLFDLGGCEIAHELYEHRVVLGETVS